MRVRDLEKLIIIGVLIKFVILIVGCIKMEVRVVSLEEIKKNNFILSPRHYIKRKGKTPIGEPKTR